MAENKERWRHIDDLEYEIATNCKKKKYTRLPCPEKPPGIGPSNEKRHSNEIAMNRYQTMINGYFYPN